MQTLKLLATSLMLLIPGPVLFAQHDVHAPLVSPLNRKPAPAFNLKNAAGKNVEISAFKGKIVLLDVWATE